MNVIVKINQTRFKANYKLMCHHLYSVHTNVGKKFDTYITDNYNAYYQKQHVSVFILPAYGCWILYEL